MSGWPSPLPMQSNHWFHAFFRARPNQVRHLLPQLAVTVSEAGAKRRARFRRRWQSLGRAGHPPALCGSAGGADRSREQVWTLPDLPLESLPAALSMKGAGGGRPHGTQRCCWRCRAGCGCDKPNGSSWGCCSRSRRAAAARPARGQGRSAASGRAADSAEGMEHSTNLWHGEGSVP
jgi:hypothetical protein